MVKRFLVLDAYDEIGLETFSQCKIASAADLYTQMLRRIEPSCQIQVMYPGVLSHSLPTRQQLTDFDGIFFTGSNLSTYDLQPAVSRQHELMAMILSGSVPCFGTCWALQLACVVAGGFCGPHPKGREFGLARKIYLTEEGRRHSFYVDKSKTFDGFSSHADEVKQLPSHGVLLASNGYSQVQAVVIHEAQMQFFGVQYHPEFDPLTVAGILRLRKDQLIALGYFRNSEEALIYANQLEALQTDRKQAAIRWQLGIDDDVLDDETRTAEVRNFLKQI